MIKPKTQKKVMTLYQSESIKSLCPMLSRYDSKGLMIDRMFKSKQMTWSKYLDTLTYQVLGFKVSKIHRDLLKSELRSYGISLKFEKQGRVNKGSGYRNGKVRKIPLSQ